MKKLILVFTAIFAVLMLSACSGSTPAAAATVLAADTSEKTASATVEAANIRQITAPFSGILLSFDIKQGDAVKKGDTLFALDTNKVYAPCDGKVGSVRALPGDNSEAVQSRYGALCYIEPEHSFMVSASIAGAYRKNRFIGIGESLYIKKLRGKASGAGKVIAVNGAAYTVEIQQGTFKIGDAVQLYRQKDRRARSKTGAGMVVRVNPVAVASRGTILKAYVKQSSKVRRGDLLFETVSGDIGAVPVAGSSMLAPADGILGNIAVSTGQDIRQGQFLASVYDATALRVNASVDEIDLAGLSVGKSVSIVFDGIPDKRYTGKVESISGIGEQKQNASYYDVRITFPQDAAIRLGMNATVYLPKK